ncbi:MAG TPA: glycosyltransferase family 4 protein [Ktedonobacterales bacterium]
MKTQEQLAFTKHGSTPADPAARRVEQHPQDVPGAAPPEPHPARRTLLVIEADVRPEVQQEVAAGRYPRKDYFELARALQADIIDWPSTQDTIISRLLARLAGKSVAQAWLAFHLRKRYDAIYTDSERLGIPLALLLKLTRTRKRHIMLTHLLSPWKKRVWFRWGRIHSHIETILCHATLQRQMMIDQLKIPPEKIALIPYQADEHFWHPMTAEEALASLEAQPRAAEETPSAAKETALPMICSVGLEFRDYPTLIEAVRGVDVQVEVAAASLWSDHHGITTNAALPANVHVSAHKYLSLRHLYASSRFVVVPLHDVPNQAGITVILEAMAMGKAVVVSATRGQTDTVRDRRNNGYGRTQRATLPGFLEAPGVPEYLRRLPTGFYVQPGDPADLRKAITYLLAHPDLADELGRNGRRVVEELMSLEAFVARIAQIIHP